MTDTEELYRAHVSTLCDRSSDALAEAGYDAVVVHAGDLVKSSRFDDLEYPFRASPSFAHWVPWPWPGSAVLFRAGRAPVLLARRRSDFWERLEAPHRSLVEAVVEVSEVDTLDRATEFRRTGKVAFVGETAAAAHRLGFDEHDINPSTLIEVLHETRVRKTPYEVEALAEANRRAVRGHRAIAEAFASGVRSELELHLAYLGAIGQGDSETPYTNIVALGDAASVLHHHAYGTRPEARSLLVDAGASVRGYGADITRTHTMDGSGPFSELLSAMEALQTGILQAIHVGMPYERLHDLAHEALGQLLVELGWVHCSAEAAVREGLTRVFFPHGLGHSLGVQVHDVGCRRSPPRPENAWLRNTRDIEPGQVFTIEPGLYFIDALLDPVKGSTAGASVHWKAIDPLRPYGGIRIEDDVFIRASGSTPPIRNLTREAFNAAYLRPENP